MESINNSIEELLEEEERKAAAKAKAVNGGQQPVEHASYAALYAKSNAQQADRGRDEKGGRDHHGSKNNRYSTEREENDDRRSRRSRDLGDDDVPVKDEVKDGSDKGSANGSVRSRRRSRSPRSDRRPESYRQRDRPAGDYYAPSGGDNHYRPGRDDRRDRDRRDNRDRSPRRDRDRYQSGRDDRRPSDPHRRKRSPEPTDDERDRRTVFVQQLAARLRTKELKAFFERAGWVVDAQIVKDRVSGRSKGYVHHPDSLLRLVTDNTAASAMLSSEKKNPSRKPSH